MKAGVEPRPGAGTGRRTLRVGILGAGHIGEVHARALARIPQVRIASICSRPRVTAQALAAAVPGQPPAVYGDFTRMLERTPLDALFICLPPYAHDGQLESAAKKGIHVFIEKPIALTVERARSMVRAAVKAGIVTQVGYHMRFGGAVRALDRMVGDGRAGLPTLFDGRYECNALHAPWWRDIGKSGGQVFEQVIHLYDLAMHFLGGPRTVTGFTANLCHRGVPGYTVEDTSAAAIRFSSGALATICGSNCAVPMQWNGIFTVVCERLTAHFRSCNSATFVFTSGKKPRAVEVTAAVDPYLEEDRAFISAVRSGRGVAATIEEGFAGLRMVSGVRESSGMNGRPVRM